MMRGKLVKSLGQDGNTELDASSGLAENAGKHAMDGDGEPILVLKDILVGWSYAELSLA